MSHLSHIHTYQHGLIFSAHSTLSSSDARQHFMQPIFFKMCICQRTTLEMYVRNESASWYSPEKDITYRMTFFTRMPYTCTNYVRLKYALTRMLSAKSTSLALATALEGL